ncbi:unnamed protein product [Urochloa humidicola]
MLQVSGRPPTPRRPHRPSPHAPPAPNRRSRGGSSRWTSLFTAQGAAAPCDSPPGRGGAHAKAASRRLARLLCREALPRVVHAFPAFASGLEELVVFLASAPSRPARGSLMSPSPPASVPS